MEPRRVALVPVAGYGDLPPAASATHGPVRARVDPLADLVRAATRGDATAIRRLLEALSPVLVRVIGAMIGPSHRDLEDMMQESLVAVMRALPNFGWECSVTHYASRVALRATRDALRRRSVAPRLAEHDDEASSAPSDDAPRVGDGVEAVRCRALLRALLDELPEEQAEALVLRVVFGHAVEEIAEASAVPVNTVRSRLRLAKQAMRRRIENDSQWAELLEVEP